LPRVAEGHFASKVQISLPQTSWAQSSPSLVRLEALQNKIKLQIELSLQERSVALRLVVCKNGQNQKECTQKKKAPFWQFLVRSIPHNRRSGDFPLQEALGMVLGRFPTSFKLFSRSRRV
jgi:hypothetical protein